MLGGCIGRPRGRRPDRPTTRKELSRPRRTAPWSQRAARRRRRVGSRAPASARRPWLSRRLRRARSGGPPGQAFRAAP
eukprot:2820550-Alexandrium_andersonii.AAC.1